MLTLLCQNVMTGKTVQDATNDSVLAEVVHLGYQVYGALVCDRLGPAKVSSLNLTCLPGQGNDEVSDRFQFAMIQLLDLSHG
jgi:hypothetical protein